MPQDPYCSNCGYTLIGLTESSKCPECGRPLVEVLTRDPVRRQGRRYRSEIVLFGLPLLHIALGPDGEERYGKARGIIAIGDVAVGWLALGGRALGLIAVGGVCAGLFAVGGLSLGVLALGGLAIGGLAAGGGAIGILAEGGGAVGAVAQGGGAAGYYARGGGAVGCFVESGGSRNPQALAFFRRWQWLFGSAPNSLLLLKVWTAIAGTLLAIILGLIVLGAYALQARASPRSN